MSAESYDAAKHFIWIQTVAKTHRTSLAESSNENPLADLFLTIFDSPLFPVIYFFVYVFVDDWQTVLYLINWKIVLLFSANIG